MDFPEKLNKLLEEKNVSAYKLAKEIGTSHVAVGQFRKNSNSPSLSTLIKIADYFGVSVDYLLGRTDNPSINK